MVDVVTAVTDQHLRLLSNAISLVTHLAVFRDSRLKLHDVPLYADPATVK